MTPKPLSQALELLSPDNYYHETNREGLDYRLRDVFRNAISFLETQKRAYVRDELPPVFKEWVHDTAKAWIEERIRKKLCGVDSRRAIRLR